MDDKQSNIDILEGLLEETGYKHFKSTTAPRLVQEKHAMLQKKLINTSAIFNQVVELLQPETQNRNVTFKIKKLYNCMGNEQLIRLVWLNLISNAIKYTAKSIRRFSHRGIGASACGLEALEQS
ncbi:MAG: hypothetical protein NT040_15740 [Bacteroidetes bacterium]|nr:hypothetical protein [Bacteroidota bacterium]